MRILAIGITFCLVFYTVCVSDQDDYNPLSDEEANAAIEKALDIAKALNTINSQNDYDAGIAAYKRGHYSVALSNFESRAMEGDRVAQFCLGFMLKNHGQEVLTNSNDTENQRDAIKWYTASASQGYLPAQNDLGVIYVHLYEESNGKNSQKLEMAKEWFQKAADQDYAPSQFNLCIISEHENTAAEWARQAADQGYPPAQNHLGSLYYHGNGVDKTPKLSVKWFRAAAEQGYPPAQHNLGICYEKGFGIDKNLEQAFRWWKKAAKQGDADGQFAVALSYWLGDSVGKDDEEALKWYRKAANQGHVVALNNLAKMYNDYALKLKKDEEKDYSEGGSKYYFEMAARWYFRAAQSGNPIAQWNIGRRFEKGKDKVPQDFVEAYYWYGLALKNKAGLKGSTVKVSDVNKARERIKKSLGNDKELISQIQEQVDDWQPKQLVVSSGTGFYCDKQFILTNKHVVRSSDEFCIPYRRVTLKDNDRELDLALLYDERGNTDENGNAVTAAFRLEDVEVGEKIFSFGYPLSDRLSYEGNLTDGIVSGPSGPITLLDFESVFQHTASTQPGNSGGPIFDALGKVIGISTYGLSSTRLQNVNFAIKSDFFVDFMEKNGIFPSSLREERRNLLRATAVSLSEEAEEVLTAKEIRAEAEKFTVPILCFKNKRQEPMSVEEIGIDGLKE